MRRKVFNTSGDFNYSYDGRSLTITGPKNREAEQYHIPDSIDGHPVDAIGNGAFQFCHALKWISVPDTVTTIDNAAFKGCENLVRAELSLSLSSIGAFAFQGCRNLRELTISNHLSRIELNSFRECSAVEVIRVKIREYNPADVQNAGEPDLPGQKKGRTRGQPDRNGMRSFAVASESEEALWLYLRAVLRATDPTVGLMDKYDATFLEIKNEEDRYRVASFRLSDPYKMTRRTYKVYKDCLMGMIETIIREDRVDRLTKLGELNCIDPAALPEYIDLAGRMGGGCIAYLLEHKNRTAKAGSYDYSL